MAGEEAPLTSCAHCGKPLPAGAAACLRCGFEPGAPQAQPLDDPRYRRKAWAALGTAAAALAFAVAYVLRNPGPGLPPASAGGEGVSIQETAPPPAAAGEWLFSGRVLDLKTLKPVPGALLAFNDLDGRRYQARSDERGFYQAALPAFSQPGNQYNLVASHPGYLPRDFTGLSADFEKLGKQRLKLAANPDAYDMPQYHLPWIGELGRLVPRDVLLLPAPKRR